MRAIGIILDVYKRQVPLNHLLLYQNKSQKKSGQSSLFQEFLLNLTVYTEVRSLPS